MKEKKYDFNAFYADDEQPEVLEFYKEHSGIKSEILSKLNEKGKMENVGGECIFSIKTILGATCELLHQENIFYNVLNSVLETKEQLATVELVSEIEKVKGESAVNSIKISDEVIKENYETIVGAIVSERFGRLNIIMTNNQVPVEFKKMLLTYMFTIRKLGNYMALPKHFGMNGNEPRNCHSVNQRKGNKTYLDDPIEFYVALEEYVGEEKNETFKDKLFETYFENDKDKEYANFLVKNKLNIIYEYLTNYERNVSKVETISFENFYLSKNISLQGMYNYMYHACNIINLRHAAYENQDK